jgi:hypothetical protein
MGEIRNAYKTSVRKCEGQKRSLTRPRHRLEDNVRNVLRGTRQEVVDCFN